MSEPTAEQIKSYAEERERQAHQLLHDLTAIPNPGDIHVMINGSLSGHPPAEQSLVTATMMSIDLMVPKDAKPLDELEIGDELSFLGGICLFGTHFRVQGIAVIDGVETPSGYGRALWDPHGRLRAITSIDDGGIMQASRIPGLPGLWVIYLTPFHE